MERKLFYLWMSIILIATIILTDIFDTVFPIFTFIWLISVLVIVFKTKNLHLIGIQKIKINRIIKFTLIHLLISLLIIFIIEITTHTYKELINISLEQERPEITFIWLEKFQGFSGYLFMFLISGLVTIFAEEIFFRGMLLQYLSKKINFFYGNLIQAILFSLPQIILALFMSPSQAIMLVFGYGIIIYGLIGGWVDYKAKAIYPSVITASINNLILFLVYLS